MTKPHHPDYVLLGTVLLLVIFGIVMVASAGIVKSLQDFSDSYYYARHQLIYGALPGLFLLFIAQRFYYRKWAKLAIPLLMITIAATILVFIPSLGMSHGGARRWLTLGFFSFQPSEFVKMFFIIYLAVWFERKGEKIKGWSETVIPFILLVGFLGMIIILQPNLGMLSIICISSIALFFAAGGRISHIFALLLGGIALFALFIKIEPYRMNRFMIFLYPEMDPQGIGYQVNQAVLAIGSGGFWGVGLGLSGQKYNYLPEPFGDSIFAVIAEELGFIGITLLVIVFLFFIWRCFAIAKNTSDKLGRLLVIGITMVIVVQFFMNIGAITGLMPLTGVPLPFVSYGGSALISALLGVGIILNVSCYTTQGSRRKW